MKIIHIVGIPGVGKTTVIKKALEGLPMNKIKYVNFGDYVFEVSKKHGIKHRDEIRKKLDRETYIEVQKEAARRIYEESKNYDLLIVDNHLVIRTEYGFYSGTPIWISDILRPTAIVIITADPEEILLRRIKDNIEGKRNREIERVSRIKLHIDLTLMHAISLMHHYNCYIKIIENREGEADRAGKELRDYILSLLNISP